MQVAGDASLEVELQARNAVTSIEVCESSLPTDGILAGSSTVILAQVITISQGLSLCTLLQGKAWWLRWLVPSHPYVRSDG